MEKFLCFMKLSKASTFIAWIKLIMSLICSFLLFVGLFLSSKILKMIEKSFGGADENGRSKFYVITILTLLGFIVYGVVSFILIIGSVNHDRVNVLSFLVIDGVVTLLLCYGFYATFFSFIWLIILIVQIYLIYTVFSYYKQLNKECATRQEHRDKQSRRPMNVGFVRSCEFREPESTDIV